MKKLLTVAAVAVIALGVAACKPQNQAGQENAPATEQASGTDAAKPADNAAGATGSENTAAPAEQNKDAGTSGSTDSSAPAEQSTAPAGQ